MIYQGETLRELSFPLGGIGAGCVAVDGYGRLVDWEIFNRPNKRSLNGYSHFAIKAESEGELLDARVMHADAAPSYMGQDYRTDRPRPGSQRHDNYGFGPQRELLGGMPHFESLTFDGQFPFAALRFEDKAFPGNVALKAFNPFIPIDDRNSSLPAAFFTVTVENTLDKPIDYTVALSLGNPQPGLHAHNAFEKDGAQGITLTDDTPLDDPMGACLTMAVDEAEQAAIQPFWFRGSWFDDLGLFWQDFTASGPLRHRVYGADESWRGKRDTATLTVRVTLEPAQKRDIRFVVSWYCPTCVNYWKPVRDDEPCAKSWRNYYATQFASSEEVAAYALKNWSDLERRTRLFADTLYASDLPPVALEAAASALAVLKSPTCMRLEDGSFYAFEGCGLEAGSCEGSCTHVWNYAFALPFLFPQLERSMRELDYGYNQRPDGGMVFRLPLPLGRGNNHFRPCVDGLMGGVIKFYRDWKICGDEQWLKKWWPAVKKSLAFAWAPTNADRWDPDQTGVITGRQHHTLDMELFGPNAWLNTFYVAALKAAAEIAAHLGESDDAALYERLYQQGRAYTEDALFNGEYFIQQVNLTDRGLIESFEHNGDANDSALGKYWNEESDEIKYQIQNGCGIDQALAQWMALLAGLGEVLDQDKVASALQSIYKYNFKPVLRDHVNPCRVYGLNDESGTVICEWPKGVKKPVVPVPYSEETMHGFEYQAASHMIAMGMEDEGLRMVKAIRDRYDGRRRNPWNEMECGSNYARSMASWALMLIYSGFEYDLSEGRMGFKPLKGSGRFFWSLDGAWGSVDMREDSATLTVLEGSVTLKTLSLPFVGATASLNGKPVAIADNRFESAVALTAGDRLTVSA